MCGSKLESWSISLLFLFYQWIKSYMVDAGDHGDLMVHDRLQHHVLLSQFLKYCIDEVSVVASKMTS